eukprot:624000-Prorocentrum_lima.AAC.1
MCHRVCAWGGRGELYRVAWLSRGWAARAFLSLGAKFYIARATIRAVTCRAARVALCQYRPS